MVTVSLKQTALRWAGHGVGRGSLPVHLMAPPSSQMTHFRALSEVSVSRRGRLQIDDRAVIEDVPVDRALVSVAGPDDSETVSG
jgi:hypothetical protein